jgi:hypothetical protein
LFIGWFLAYTKLDANDGFHRFITKKGDRCLLRERESSQITFQPRRRQCRIGRRAPIFEQHFFETRPPFPGSKTLLAKTDGRTSAECNSTPLQIQFAKINRFGRRVMTTTTDAKMLPLIPTASAPSGFFLRGNSRSATSRN